MDLRPSNDIPLLISSANSSSERRVSPSWSIAHFKSRLEPITGIPVSAQSLRLGSRAIEAADEESTQLSAFDIQPYAELQVSMLMKKNFLLTIAPPHHARTRVIILGSLHFPFEPVLARCAMLAASFDKPGGAT
jgi:hypothetical protein